MGLATLKTKNQIQCSYRQR